LAAKAWTHSAVVALFPEYIYRRFAGHDEGRIAQEAGVSVDALTLDSLGSLAYAPLIAKNNILSVARYRWRTPNISVDPWTPVWDDLVASGFAIRVGEGWSLSERGTGLCDHVHREVRRYLESLNVPSAELSRLTAAVTSLADGIPSDAERTMCAHRGLPLQEAIRSNIVRVDRAISELWNFRDDSHIAAWQAAGYAGPTVDVVSQVWEGKKTIDDVASELEGRPKRFDIESQVDMLVESGDMEHHAELLTLTGQGKDRRDRIERDTDARYFREWPRGEVLRRMGDDLAAVIGALP
jgi:hypothetical protein